MAEQDDVTVAALVSERAAKNDNGKPESSLPPDLERVVARTFKIDGLVRQLEKEIHQLKNDLCALINEDELKKRGW